LGDCHLPTVRTCSKTPFSLEDFFLFNQPTIFFFPLSLLSVIYQRHSNREPWILFSGPSVVVVVYKRARTPGPCDRPAGGNQQCGRIRLTGVSHTHTHTHLTQYLAYGQLVLILLSTYTIYYMWYVYYYITYYTRRTIEITDGPRYYPPHWLFSLVLYYAV